MSASVGGRHVLAVEFVDQFGDQFWTDSDGRILRHNPDVPVDHPTCRGREMSDFDATARRLIAIFRDQLDQQITNAEYLDSKDRSLGLPIVDPDTLRLLYRARELRDGIPK